MGDREEETPGIPAGDVERARHDHEETAADQRQQAQSFQRMDHGGDWRPLEQLGVHDPQLGQQQGDRDEAGRDVDSLGDPVEAGRTRRPVEPARRLLDEVAEDAGAEAQDEGDAERDADEGGDAGLVEPALGAVFDPTERSRGRHEGDLTPAAEPWRTTDARGTRRRRGATRRG